MTPGLPLSRLRWRPSYRIVPSRFPQVGLFDRVADPGDLEAVMALEVMTNARLRQQAGDIQWVPRAERISGPGTTPIMADFTHLNPDGSRFSDGSYGAYYAAASERTSLKGTRYHAERFMRFSREGPMRLEMRAYLANIEDDFHDIRAMGEHHPEWYDPVDYSRSQALGGALRAAASNGIAYDSVRDTGGECVAVFRPRAVQPVVQGGHYEYIWDGERISAVLRVDRILKV